MFSSALQPVACWAPSHPMERRGRTQDSGGRGPGRPTLPTSLGWTPLPEPLWEESMLYTVGAMMGPPRGPQQGGTCLGTHGDVAEAVPDSHSQLPAKGRGPPPACHRPGLTSVSSFINPRSRPQRLLGWRGAAENAEAGCQLEARKGWAIPVPLGPPGSRIAQVLGWSAALLGPSWIPATGVRPWGC